MTKEDLPQPKDKLGEFNRLLGSQLALNKGTSNGWFGFVNPGHTPISEVEAKIRQTAEATGTQVDTFDYLAEPVNMAGWFELVDKYSGVDASLIILKPADTKYADEQQRANHFAMGMQGYGLPVRNNAHEHGHGIIIIAPEGISPEVYTPTYLSNPDLASFSSISVKLD